MRNTLLALLLSLTSIPIFAQDCEINDLIVEAHPCINGTFLVDIDFNVVNPEGDMFGVVGNATDYGFFPYDTLPLTLGPLEGDGDTEWEFIVFDAEEPNCQATFVLGIVTCCEIHDVVVDPQECQNTETFSAIVNFNYTNTGGLGFDAFDADENPLGFFLYEDLPVTIDGIPSSGTGDDVIILCDNDNLDCCTVVEFEGPDCDPTDCEIYDVVADATACASGEFFVFINFEFENVGATFTIQGNGNNYGTFSYDSLPVQIGPFDGDGESVYEFVVIDSQTDGCSDFTVLEALDCPASCGFNDVVIEPFECVNDTSYNLDLDFIPISVGDAGFSVYAAGMLLGEYAYDDLPVVVENFPASGDFFDELTICDNADTACCQTHEFQALLCGECVIYEMVAEPSECDSNAQFFITIDFEYQNVGASGFQIGGNGNIYGTFEYADLPITLGPFDGDDMTFWEFVVFDLDNPLCIQGVEVGVINCINPCEIGELIVDALECTGDGTYNLFLDFDYANTDSVGFDVWAGDDFIGFYSYDDLPLTIEDFPASGGDLDEITVCDNDNPDCCSTASFLSPGCFEICDIWDIIVAPIECTTDSTFSALVTFLYEHLDNEFVDIWSGDKYLGFYSVDSLPVLVDGFPSSFGDVEITICENDNEMCCESREFDGLQCDTTCTITELVVDTDECLDDGTYNILVDFEADGLTSVNVNVTIDGEAFGVYPAADAPFVVDGIPGNGGVSVIVVCDNDNPDCCAATEYEAPTCEVDSCEIWDLVLDGTMCNDDGTFNTWLNFNYTGLISSFVRVYNNDTEIGIYPLDSLPLYLEGLPGDGENAVISVCDNDNTECCGAIEYEAPLCDVECEIFDVILDGVQCQDDGTYSMFIVFETQGLQNEFVDVWLNGEFLGFFPADSAIFVEGIEGDGGEAELEICENDNDDCCVTFIFDQPLCEGCGINELAVDPAECTSDSTFGAWVEFGSVGIDSNVVIYADGEYLGSFPPISPLFVTGFPSGDGNILVEVCGDDSTRTVPCCAEVEIEQLNCSETGCPIGAVSATVSDCDSNGTFTVTLDVEIEGSPGGGFIVAGNGMTYGSFGYDDLPITIGPLEGDNETDWEFIVIDLGDPTCSNFTELGVIDCETSGLFGPSTQVSQLQVLYRDGHPFFEVPASDLRMSIMSATGAALVVNERVNEQEMIYLDEFVQHPGVVIVQLINDKEVYVAKAVTPSP